MNQQLLDQLTKPDQMRLHLGEMTAQEMRTAQAAVRYALTKVAEVIPKPIDMILLCPECKTQHIDAPDMEVKNFQPTHASENSDGTYSVGGTMERWTNPPHRSHLCAACGCIWRQADVPTNGVAKLQTVGKADTCHFDPVWQVSSGAMRKLIRDGEH